jgi:hypothetical protein
MEQFRGQIKTETRRRRLTRGDVAWTLERERADQGGDDRNPHDRVTCDDKVSQSPINRGWSLLRGVVRMFSDHQRLRGRCPGDKVNVGRCHFTPFESGSHQNCVTLKARSQCTLYESRISVP